MKLILAIVSNDDSSTVSAALSEEKFYITRISSTGGFLRAGNVTLMMGVDDDRVERAIEIIRERSHQRTEVVPATAALDIARFSNFPVEVKVGGATIFVLDIEQFVKV